MKEHTHSTYVICDAKREDVYKVIYDSSQWPYIFPPCQSVKTLSKNQLKETIEVTANVNGINTSWQSERKFCEDTYSIQSRSLKPMPLMSSMYTNWLVVKLSAHQSMLVLEHKFTLAINIRNSGIENVNNHNDAIVYLKKAIHSNSKSELSKIKELFSKKKLDKMHNRVWNDSRSIFVNVEASNIYDSLVNVSNWPKIIDACVEASTKEKLDNTTEIITVKAIDGDKELCWDSKRKYYKNINKIEFDLINPMPLLKKMSGSWRVIPLSKYRSILHVERNFEILDDVENIIPGVVKFRDAKEHVKRFVDKNADSEMISIKDFCEHGKVLNNSIIVQSIIINKSANNVYKAFSDISLWKNILSHCKEINVIYNDDNYQEFSMNVLINNNVENIRSVRICRRDELIIEYFQPKPPSFLKKSSGKWILEPIDNKTKVSVVQKVEFYDTKLQEVFGTGDPQIVRPKAKAIQSISKNSATTLKIYKELIENKQSTKDYVHT